MKVKPWREKCKENDKERDDFSEAQLRGSGEPQEGKDAPPRESDCPVALPTVFLEHQNQTTHHFLSKCHWWLLNGESGSFFVGLDTCFWIFPDTLRTNELPESEHIQRTFGAPCSSGAPS